MERLGIRLTNSLYCCPRLVIDLWCHVTLQRPPVEESLWLPSSCFRLLRKTAEKGRLKQSHPWRWILMIWAAEDRNCWANGRNSRTQRRVSKQNTISFTSRFASNYKFNTSVLGLDKGMRGIVAYQHLVGSALPKSWDANDPDGYRCRTTVFLLECRMHNRKPSMPVLQTSLSSDRPKVQK